MSSVKRQRPRCELESGLLLFLSIYPILSCVCVDFESVRVSACPKAQPGDAAQTGNQKNFRALVFFAREGLGVSPVSPSSDANSTNKEHKAEDFGKNVEKRLKELRALLG